MEETAKRKIKLGISIGDPNGVGIELVLKVFQDKRMFDFFTPIVFANTKLMSAQRKHFNLQTPFVPYVLGKKLSKNQLNVVEVFDTIKGTGIHEPDVRSTMIRTTYNSTFRSVNPWKGVSFDTNIYFNSTQGMKYPSSVIINLP